MLSQGSERSADLSPLLARGPFNMTASSGRPCGVMNDVPSIRFSGARLAREYEA